MSDRAQPMNTATQTSTALSVNAAMGRRLLTDVLFASCGGDHDDDGGKPDRRTFLRCGV